MSVDKAYAELLAGKKSTKVIVGVIDSGVDISHDDLKSVIWTNNNNRGFDMSFVNPIISCVIVKTYNTIKT